MVAFLWVQRTRERHNQVGKKREKGGGRGEKDEGEKRRVVYGPRITGERRRRYRRETKGSSLGWACLA